MEDCCHGDWRDVAGQWSVLLKTSITLDHTEQQTVHPWVTQEGEAGSERHWLFPCRQGHLREAGEKTVPQEPENSGQGLRVFRGKCCLREYRMSPGNMQIQLG